MVTRPHEAVGGEGGGGWGGGVLVVVVVVGGVIRCAAVRQCRWVGIGCWQLLLLVLPSTLQRTTDHTYLK